MIRTSKRSTLDADAARRGFPQRKSFVLQFSSDAGPRTGLFRGRIEHVTSGEQVAFGSTEEFWAFVRNVLAQSNEPAEPRPATGNATAPASPDDEGTRIAEGAAVSRVAGVKLPALPPSRRPQAASA